MSKKTQTVEEKLKALYTLQLIDSSIDKIRTVRGELPIEVQDLEDELEGLKTRKGKIEEEIAELELAVNKRKNTIEEAKEAIKKYESQQGKVRNNREFDAISKEIEFQQLEIELSEKRIKEHKAQIENKKEVLSESAGRVEERQELLDQKKKELDEIIAETKKEEEILIEQSEKEAKKIDDRLLKAYRRIRSGAKNGLAVVPVERGASGGSFISIPPQRQLDIATRTKIIVDEHSGRILVDQDLAEELSSKVEKTIAKLLK
mgnify:CR=1 FL=1